MNALANNLYIFAMFIPLVSLHEAAHAWVARLLGDDTAEIEGRLTLNPASHIDLWGTILIPAINLFIFQGMAPIAWGRPVPVDSANLSHPRRDEIVIALAGPFANVLIGFVTVAAGVWLIPADSVWQKLPAMFAMVSVFLAFFNLLPIPGFDGWPILRNALRLPHDLVERGTVWWLIGIVLVLNFTPLIDILFVATKTVLTGFHVAVGGGAMPQPIP